MTSPEWLAADEDDADRFPQTAHVPALPATHSPDEGSRVAPDPARVARYAEAIRSCVIANPEQMRDLTEAVVAVADEERAALVAELKQVRKQWHQEVENFERETLRAEAAEAKVAKVEAHANHIDAVADGRASMIQGYYNQGRPDDALRLETDAWSLRRAATEIRAGLAKGGE